MAAMLAAASRDGLAEYLKTLVESKYPIGINTVSQTQNPSDALLLAS